MKINFRNTAEHAVEGLGQTLALNTENYPTVKNEITFGWVSTGTVSALDRNNSDPRFAGTHEARNDEANLFVVDTGAGNFDVRLAIGEGSFGSANNYVSIVEVNSSNVVQSVLAVVAENLDTSGSSFADATGVVRSNTEDWFINNVAVNVTIASGNRLAIRLGDGTSGGTSQIVHLDILDTNASSATFSDDFTRENESPLAFPWQSVEGAAFNLSNNSVFSVSSGISALIGQNFKADQSGEITFTPDARVERNGVGVRFDADGNGYVAEYVIGSGNLDSIFFYRFDEGVKTRIGVSYYTPASVVPLKLKLEISGSNLFALINGVRVGNPQTDSTYAEGVPAIYFSNAPSVSNFVTNFEASGFTVVPLIVQVNGGVALVDGQQNVAFEVTDFLSDVTSASLRVGSNTISLSGLTGSGTNYTVNLPDIEALTVDTNGIPFTSINHDVEFVATNATESSATPITLNPKAGFVVVDTINALATKGYAFNGRVGGAMADTSQFLFSPAGSTIITPDGLIESDLDEFDFKAWNVTSGEWEVADFTYVDVDTTAPVITVSGQSSTTVTVNGTAPTFTASTDDGSTVVVTGDTVDMTTLGTYVIRYNATDAAGNAATEVTRTVIVSAIPDTTAPIITVSGQATTTITFGDALPTFTASTDDGSTVVTTGTAVNQVGTYTLRYNATDSAGNQAQEVTRVVVINAVTQTTSTAQVTITGITNGTHAIKLWNDATNAILFNGNLTFTDTTATTSLDVAAGTVFVGRWLGDNPPTTGTGIYGVTV